MASFFDVSTIVMLARKGKNRQARLQRDCGIPAVTKAVRMLVQASAGTGDLSFFVCAHALTVRPNKKTGQTFLLTTLYLWCVVNGVHCKAAAPTGIVGALVGLVHMLRVLPRVPFR